VIAVVALHALFLWNVRERIAKGDPDFTVFYTAAKMVRAGYGRSLYQSRAQQEVQRGFTSDSDIRRGPLPYLHPPFEAVIFVPLTLLSYPQAFAVWDLANLVMLLGVILLLRRSVSSLRRVSLWESVLACLAFFPVFINFLQGQDAILFLLLVAVGFCDMERGSDFMAGAWFGLGVFKYHLMVPLVVMLALRRGRAGRGRKLLLGFSVVAALTVVLSLGMVGWQGALEYPLYVWRAVSVPGFGQTPYGMNPSLLGLVAGWPVLERLIWPARLVTLAGSAVLLILVSRMRAPVNDRGLSHLSTACAVIAAILVSYSANAHDLCLLILPLVLVADYCRGRDWPSVRELALPALPLLISPLWIFSWIRWGRINFVAALLLWWIYVLRRRALLSGEAPFGLRNRITANMGR